MIATLGQLATVIRDNVTTQLSVLRTAITAMFQQQEDHLSDIDDAIAQLQQDVASQNTVVGSAVTAFQGIAAQIAALHDNQKAAGVDPAQLAELQALHAALAQQTTNLAQAIPQNTPAAPVATATSTPGTPDTAAPASTDPAAGTIPPAATAASA